MDTKDIENCEDEEMEVILHLTIEEIDELLDSLSSPLGDKVYKQIFPIPADFKKTEEEKP